DRVVGEEEPGSGVPTGDVHETARGPIWIRAELGEYYQSVAAELYRGARRVDLRSHGRREPSEPEPPDDRGLDREYQPHVEGLRRGRVRHGLRYRPAAR